MAYSCAIIAADHGGLADIVLDRQTGLKFEPNNEHALAEAIEYYVRNPEHLRQHGLAGRNRFEENYTIDVYSKNLISAIERYVSH